jgi:hypothetical protein
MDRPTAPQPADILQHLLSSAAPTPSVSITIHPGSTVTIVLAPSPPAATPA